MLDLAHLRRVAEEATQGEWRQHLVDDTTIISGKNTEIACTFPSGGLSDDVDFYSDVEQKEADARHIAACNPATILALLDRLEAAERLVQSAFHEGFGQGMREHTSYKGGYSWADSKAAAKLATHAALTLETNKQDTHP